MNTLQLMRLLHHIGIAWGAGGATIAAILRIKAEKDPQIAPVVMRLMPTISKLIWVGLILLAVSGIGLAKLTRWPVDSDILRIKIGLVVVLVLNGLNMMFRVMPKMAKLAPKGGAPSAEFLKMKNYARFAGMLGLALWGLILIFSVTM